MLALVTLLVVSQIASVSPARLISEKGVGPIRPGMTLGEARKAAPGAAFARVGDGDGAALVQVTFAKGVTLQVWADEDDPEKPIDWRKKIRTIETFSPAFRTAEGAHPGMKVSDLHRLYGATRSIETTEIESRQFITFEKHPSGLLFRLDETGRAILSIAVSSR
ncbi:MAG: hypothetical protein M3R55_02125 [Acidobacteriota bacterium]|nr:hypothetical protein [Acidobacteriota bacterium]